MKSSRQGFTSGLQEVCSKHLCVFFLILLDIGKKRQMPSLGLSIPLLKIEKPRWETFPKTPQEEESRSGTEFWVPEADPSGLCWLFKDAF